MSSGTRPCPHCGGEIKVAAILCKHCRQPVVTAASQTAVASQTPGTCDEERSVADQPAPVRPRRRSTNAATEAEPARSVFGVIATVVLILLSLLITVVSMEDGTISEAGWGVAAAVFFMLAVPIRNVGLSFARVGIWLVTFLATSMCLEQPGARIPAAVALIAAGGMLMFWRPARRLATPVGVVLAVAAVIGGGFATDHRNAHRAARLERQNRELGELEKAAAAQRAERRAETRRNPQVALDEARRLIRDGQPHSARSLLEDLEGAVEAPALQEQAADLRRQVNAAQAREDEAQRAQREERAFEERQRRYQATPMGCLDYCERELGGCFNTYDSVCQCARLSGNLNCERDCNLGRSRCDQQQRECVARCPR